MSYFRSTNVRATCMFYLKGQHGTRQPVLVHGFLFCGSFWTSQSCLLTEIIRSKSIYFLIYINIFIIISSKHDDLPRVPVLVWCVKGSWMKHCPVNSLSHTTTGYDKNSRFAKSRFKKNSSCIKWWRKNNSMSVKWRSIKNSRCMKWWYKTNTSCTKRRLKRIFGLLRDDLKRIPDL